VKCRFVDREIAWCCQNCEERRKWKIIADLPDLKKKSALLFLSFRGRR